MQNVHSLVWVSSIATMALLGCGNSVLGSGDGPLDPPFPLGTGGSGGAPLGTGGPGGAPLGTGGPGGAPIGGCDGALCHGACVDTSSDASNCGACGHDCLGGACVAGACQPVVLAADAGRYPYSLAVAGDSVFWATLGDDLDSGPTGGIYRVGKAGGPTATVLAGLRGPDMLAANATNLYFRAQPGLVEGVPQSGGAATMLASGAKSALAVSSSTLFYADQAAGTVAGLPLAGGTPVVLASGLDAPSALAVSGANVFCGDLEGVKRIPIGPGSGAVQLLSPKTPNGPLVVDATSVYWTSDVAILSVPQGGGVVRKIASSASGTATFAVDDQFVYWVIPSTPEQPDEAIARAPIAGGPTVTLVPALAVDIQAIAVDATSVYWTSFGPNGSNAVVMRLAK